MRGFGTQIWKPKETPITVDKVAPGFPIMRIAGGRRVLVYLPGLSDAFISPLENPDAFTRVFPQLRASHTVYFLGRAADRPAGLGITDLTDDIAEAIRAIMNRENLGEPCVDIAGSAFGGVCALAVAARHPEFTRRISINSAAHRMSEEGQSIIRGWLPTSNGSNWPMQWPNNPSPARVRSG